MDSELPNSLGVCSEQEEVAANFRRHIEEREQLHLADSAARSYPAHRGRPEPDCSLRTPFQRDRDRIVHSKSFRRLKHKTQVFVAPVGDHYRTRLTHTLEVTQVSRTVARALSLNEDLTEAIGLGHDLGHAPFGHIGEEVLGNCLKERFGKSFRHNLQSLRVVDILERDYRGLNLTEQVRDGIVNHTSGMPKPQTLEGAIVRLVDRIAYINHDIDDALRAGVIEEIDLPKDEIATLGSSGSERIDTLVHDLVETSHKAGEIVQSKRIGSAMLRLRKFMFDRVYLGPQAQSEYVKVELALKTLFDYYCENPDALPATSQQFPLHERVADYLAGMTDHFCIRTFTELTVPKESSI